MISALVFVADEVKHPLQQETEFLARSLAWLVSAVVSGVVRDVVLAGPPEFGLAAIADSSGCAIAEGREGESLRLALALCRGPRVLLIRSAFQPGETMIGELDSLARSLAPGEAARLLAAPCTLLQHIFPDIAPTVGLLAPLEHCRAAPAGRFPALVAALKPRARFATRATPIL